MNNKIVVYTAVFGNYSGLIPQAKYKNIDFVCYTDQDIKAKNWKIIKVKPPVEGDNTRSNRYYKILPHKHVDKKYKISVYIDANIWVLKDIYAIVEEKMKIAKMACFDHNQNKADRRDCIYKEHQAILDYGLEKGVYKDDPLAMEKQMNRFKEEGYPENCGLITAPILIRKHFDGEIIKLMETWWDVVLHESKRDQLSFNYAAWKLDFTDITHLDGDVRKGNPWFYTISHRKNYRFKMFKIKLKKAFGKNK